MTADGAEIIASVPSVDHGSVDRKNAGLKSAGDNIASGNIASENIAGENIAGENIAGENIAGENIASENAHPTLKRYRVARFSLAILFVVLATLLTRLTHAVLGEISPFFFTAVMLSTWFGGLAPGLLATGLAAWCSAYFFFNLPKGTGAFGFDDALRLSVFLMIALLMSYLMHLRQRAERALRSANDHLENRVAERTAELQHSNQMVRESEEGFRALVEGVTDSAICMLDSLGTVISWNSGAEHIQGYKDVEILKTGFHRFYTSLDQLRKKPEQDLARTREQGRHFDEGWRVRKDGSLFWANVIITPLKNADGQIRGFAHVARDVTELNRLEKEVLEIAEKEQRRIGHDLHDGISQELTGLAFLSQNLSRKLGEQSLPEASAANRISNLINSTIEQARELAKGLAPVELGSDGLLAALRNLARRIHDTYNINCEFQTDRSVQVRSHTAAVHLYRIAQEALNNAARHSGATRISISICRQGFDTILLIQDNGRGIVPNANTASQDPSGESGKTSQGMGLHLMPYRARMIGASFEIKTPPDGGTVIRCVYPEESEVEPTSNRVLNDSDSSSNSSANRKQSARKPNGEQDGNSNGTLQDTSG